MDHQLRLEGKSKKKIESSQELQAMLEALRQMMNADAAILYQLINVDEIEVTEILDELSKSNILSKIREIEDKKFKEVIEKYKNALNKYTEGKLFEELSKEERDEIKSEIRLIRCCEVAENPNKEKRWNFGYNVRPPKYIIFEKFFLCTEPLPNEGETGAFCRTRGNICGEKKVGNEIPTMFKSREKIDCGSAHNKDQHFKNRETIMLRGYY